MTGAASKTEKLIIRYDQSVAYVLAGTAIKVMALILVPAILSPAAHHGMRPLALKKEYK